MCSWQMALVRWQLCAQLHRHPKWRMLKLAQCVALGALQRTESRGAHFRADYPRRDDARWLRRTLCHWDGGERPRLNLTRRGDSGDSGPAKVAPYAAPPSSGGGGDKWDNMFGGGNRGPQSDPPPPSRYGAGGGESRYGGGGGDARGGYGGPSRYGAGSSDRPSGMGRYGSGNRYGALQTGSSAPAPRKEEFPTMAAATTKKEEPKHVKEARLAMEKVKLEKRRLAEEAHRKEQEAAAAKKKAEREAAEQAEAAAKQKALEDAEKARVAGLESAKKLEGLTGQALADAVAKLPDKPNADAFATARFAKRVAALSIRSIAANFAPGRSSRSSTSGSMPAFIQP